jgi:hypothetical protein
MNFNLLKNVIQKTEKNLYEYCGKKILGLYKTVDLAQKYIYAKGEIPIMLTAHLDTVHRKIPEDIFYDKNKKVIWSPDGIGGDDRCGVYSILHLIANGYRPHVLFTTGEETGGVGADAFVSDYPLCPVDINYVLELDRHGIDDVVFYNCGNENFQKYIQTFGFKKAWGTFSDISIISPAWEVASANVSMGYFNEHTASEYVNLTILENTISKVINMLCDTNTTFFDHCPVYVNKWYNGYGYSGYKAPQYNTNKKHVGYTELPLLKKPPPTYEDGYSDRFMNGTERDYYD